MPIPRGLADETRKRKIRQDIIDELPLYIQKTWNEFKDLKPVYELTWFEINIVPYIMYVLLLMSKTAPISPEDILKEMVRNKDENNRKFSEYLNNGDIKAILRKFKQAGAEWTY